jgi:hypothetical protein
LQSVSASIEGSLPENTASWQARFNHEERTIWIVDEHRAMTESVSLCVRMKT